MKARTGIGTALVVLLTLAGPLGAMEQAHHTFTIPWFEVGPVTTVPGGTTTLFAVTNVGGSTATATITRIATRAMFASLFRGRRVIRGKASHVLSGFHPIR